MKTIDRFQGEYHFLSNFARSMINIGGLDFPTVEHAFQACKMTTLADAKLVQSTVTPWDAKKLARSLPMRADWERTKYHFMYDCVKAKFSRGALRLMLMDTAPAILIEGNTWGDICWGMVLRQGVWVGENNLGKTLMEVRQELLEGKPQ